MIARLRLLPAVLVLLAFAAACAPASVTTTAVPTLTLIPATATLTPTVAPPTPTASNLVVPQDVSTPTPSPTPEISLADLTGEALVAQDPVAAELVGIAQRVVADDLDLPVRRIQLIDVRAVVWTDSALNCPPPDTEVVPGDTDGYRILLGVAEQEFLFHTDVDRVVPCDPANEQLQPGMLGDAEATDEATEAATSEATDDATAEATPEATES